MASETAICNTALRWAGSKALGSFSEATELGQKCRDLYHETLDDLLRAHPWQFAARRAKLPRLKTSPEYEFDYEYQFPVGYIRTISVHDNEAGAGFVVYKIERGPSGSVLRSNAAHLYLRYVARPADPNHMPGDFRMALALQLASALAVAVGHDERLSRDLRKRALRARDVAKHNDTSQGTPDPKPEPAWLRIRGRDEGNTGKGPEPKSPVKELSLDTIRTQFLSGKTGGRFAALLDALVATHVIEETGAEAGAIGSNRNGWDSANPQRFLHYHIMSAIEKDAAATSTLWTNTDLAIAYTFAHQVASGTFSNTLGLSELDAAEGTSFPFSRIMRVLSMGLDFPDRFDVTRFHGDARKVIDWIVQPATVTSLVSLSGSGANRLWFAAQCCSIAARFWSSSSYYTTFRSFANTALARQNADGSFYEPNAAGKDGGYQSVSIDRLQSILLWWPTDVEVAGDRALIEASRDSAIAWLVTQINLATGQIADGDRTTGTGIQYHIAALVLWSHYDQTKDTTYESLGNLVYDYGVLIGAI